MLKRLVITFVAGVLICAMVMLIMRVASSRAALTGAMAHETTAIIIDDAATVTHSFRLTNASGGTITVAQLKPSCSCLRGRAETTSIADGDDLVIEVEMTVEKTAKKTERLHVLLEPIGNRTLEFTVNARRDNPIRPIPSPLRFNAAGTAGAPITVERWLNDPTPPDVNVTVSAGFEAALSSWREFKPAQPSEGRPALWRADLLITRTDNADTSEDAVVTVSMHELETTHDATAQLLP
ncbi:MAG: DUF1573 domain-containing protein [Planctomycetota bacterium]